jgi:putative transferase (TIGR04331 family)
MSFVIILDSDKEQHVRTKQLLFNHVLIAINAEHGAKVIWYQPGSFCGEFAGDSEHHYEHDISDEFRTWGWKIKAKDTPWKAYRLEKFRREYEQFPNTKECDLLISFSRISEENRQANRELTDYLLEYLDPDKYRKILARPQPANRVLNQKGQLDFINNDRVIKSTGLTTMDEDMSRCRVVLQMRVPSTNFLECMFTNHPTVGILKKDEYTDIIKPYHSFFFKHGILHDNLESLVEHLNSISIEDWWEELSDKKKYESFKNIFLNKV